jgi:hypothetical protein
VRGRENGWVPRVPRFGCPGEGSHPSSGRIALAFFPHAAPKRGGFDGEQSGLTRNLAESLRPSQLKPPGSTVQATILRVHPDLHAPLHSCSAAQCPCAPPSPQSSALPPRPPEHCVTPARAARPAVPAPAARARRPPHPPACCTLAPRAARSAQGLGPARHADGRVRMPRW